MGQSCKAEGNTGRLTCCSGSLVRTLSLSKAQRCRIILKPLRNSIQRLVGAGFMLARKSNTLKNAPFHKTKVRGQA